MTFQYSVIKSVLYLINSDKSVRGGGYNFLHLTSTWFGLATNLILKHFTLKTKIDFNRFYSKHHTEYATFLEIKCACQLL